MEPASDSDEESKVETQKPKSGKNALKKQLALEQEIRDKEAAMRSKEGAQPQSVNDFERMLVADQD